MARSNTYIFGFALAVCVVCSLGVAGAAVALKDLQDLNRERDLKGNILDALQLVPEGETLDGDEIDRLWEERVEIVVVEPSGEPVAPQDCPHDLDADGDCDLEDAILAREQVKGTAETPPLLALYKRVDQGEVGAWAIPLYGKGLWGPISGYVALSPDASEVIGTTFFAPKETPGLGAEIVEPPFEQQWVGKKIFEDGEPRAIQVAKGSAEALYPGEIDHWVDGVSGATITSRGVTAMSIEGIEKHYAQTLVRLHGGTP